MLCGFTHSIQFLCYILMISRDKIDSLAKLCLVAAGLLSLVLVHPCFGDGAGRLAKEWGTTINKAIPLGGAEYNIVFVQPSPL